MRVIELKETATTIEIGSVAQETKIVDKDVLHQVANHVTREEGQRWDSMGKALDLMDKIKAANGRLILEDAEHELLCSKIKVMPFAINNRAIFELCDRVIKSPFVSTDALKKLQAEWAKDGEKEVEVTDANL